ncbi:MAG: PAS domain S-box protein [Nitrospirae bacterium]|nr:PAS domain S-box protein [Nitrospirota bacterium]
MKKKIIIVLSIVCLFFFLGGIYLIRAIDANASRFDNIIMFHQIEILREHLLLNMREVQADVYSQGTTHEESADAVMSHVHGMKNTMHACFECHHSEIVTERLLDLRNQVDQYGEALSTLLDLKVNTVRFRAEQEYAHIIGDSLVGKLNTMIVLTTKKLHERTEEALQEVHHTRTFLLTLVAAGPLLIAILAFTVIRGVTGPIGVLLAATRKLKAGDLEYRIKGLHDEFGELAIGFNVMAGSLKEQVKKIEESEIRYRLLFESAGDAIFILDAEGDAAGAIVAANQAAVAMHGYSHDELLALNIRDLDAPEDAARVPERLLRMFNGEWIKTEINHIKKDGTVFPVEISAGLLEFGNHRYILALDRDITERKQMEQALQRTEQIKCAGELATGLAHEIKNPLAGIKVSIEVLSHSLEKNLPEEDKDLLAKVIDEIKRIESLIKGLLNFARPPLPQFVKTDVNAVLDSVASLVLQNQPRTPGAATAIDLVRDLDGNLPEISADPMQLRQVFMNLLLNAVDAMKNGGNLGIKTRFDAMTQSVRVELSDTGRGIDAAVMGKLFQPFFTTKSKGTGLGLAISKRLVEDHGGKIGIEQNAAGGATFIITLPAAPSERMHTA